jgi:alpha-mannosidase
MRTLHLISHTHWDREWYLPFQEFRYKLVRLMDKLLDLLAADPAFRFFMLDGQTIVLDDYLAVRPEREEEIRALVQAGRLLIGPWHILPDEFLVSPEATVRNLLQGKRTAARFGPRMAVGYIPDPFGHIGQMPQILRGFGLETAALRRGLADEPCELHWQAPDGSTVFLAYLRDGYDNAYPYPLARPEDIAPFFAGVRQLRDSLLPHTATDQILLMHGTDHMEAQPLTSAALAQAAGQLDGDTLVHSTLPAYLCALQEDLRGVEIPTVTGELRNPKRHHLLPGVLSARMWIKQRNHACETLLEKWAEPFGVWAASLAPCEGPCEGPSQGVLHHAWRLLLECHPHDSICGCSVDQVHEEMRVRFDQVEQIGEALVQESLGAIAGAVQTSPPPPFSFPSPPCPPRKRGGTREKGRGGAKGQGEEVRAWSRAVVVFNPLTSQRSDTVTVEFETPSAEARFQIVDEAGRVLPARMTRAEEQEIDYRVLGRAGLLALLASVQNGRSSGRAIVGLQLRQEPPCLYLDVAVTETGEPDPAAVALGLAQLEAALSDPSLSRFVVRACSYRAAIEFFAPDIPGHGYRTFWLRTSAGGALTTYPSYALLPPDGKREPWLRPLAEWEEEEEEEEGPPRIENEFLILQAAPDGTLTLTDKRTGAVFSGLNRFVDGGDCGDEYNYAPPDADMLVTGRPVEDIVVYKEGAAQVLAISLEMELPGLTLDRRSRTPGTLPLTIATTARLLPGVPRVDITTIVDNRSWDHRLRVHFPVPFAVDAADYDGHFQVVRRPTTLPAHDATWVEDPRPEVPQRAFCDVSDGQVGLMLANRGLPEVAVLPAAGGSEVALTLLRCVGWLSRADFSTRRGHAGPAVATPGAQERGRHIFEYALIPHAGDWTAAYPAAYAFNAPLRAVDVPPHAGELPAAASLLRVQPAAFVLSTVKPTEDGVGVIVRGYNITGAPIRATLSPLHRFTHATRVRLDEEEVEDLELAEDGSVTLEVRGHKIVTVRFE